MNERILIFGAGAVGCGVGGMLARAGFPVVLLGRPHVLDPLAADGLRLTGIWGDHQVPPGELTVVTGIGEIDTPPDVVFVTTKSWATAAAARALEPLARSELPVVSLQNGVGNAETLAEHLPEAVVVAGMIIIGFDWLGPGRLEVTVAADRIKLGALNGADKGVADKVAAMLRAADVPAEAVPDIACEQWSKLLYNAALNPLGALLNARYGELTHAASWSIIEDVVREAFAVLDAADIGVRWERPGEYLQYLRHEQIPATSSHFPSMLRDLERGRPSEIGALNGRIVDLGQEYGVPTPVNGTLVRLIHAAVRRQSEDLPLR